MSKKQKTEYVAVGGQALMEGIMMRGPKGTAMSLRLPDGSIETQMKDFVSLRRKHKILNIPIIRGVIAFVESMVFGYKLLMESAEKTSLDTEEEAESKFDKWISDHFGPKMMTVIGVISAVLGFALAFLLFMWLPSFLFDLVNEKLAHGSMMMWRTIFEGVLRIIIFVTYMALTARMKEIHRTYMYHGAEHKTIFCLEHGKELTVANIREEKRFHPRCGTSFLFVVIIVSILVSTIVFPYINWQNIWVRIGVKLLLLVPVVGVTYEFNRFVGAHDNAVTRILSAPGMWMQNFTTNEPDDSMIEVAIEAMKLVIPAEQGKDQW